ncbi:DUF3592 domain-containing protein [Streptomyces sp. NPDC001536]|uniref:Rv1733c family protein n=1 Tax=Streptomyces sp. NPDC001536 TaxID=3364583 RepID=UPI0036AF223E
MRARVRGWRWRANPLRRRSDVVEAWTALAVAVLLLVAAPLAGVAVGGWARAEAQETAVSQRAERHSVRAEVVGRDSDSAPTMQSARQHSYRTTVRWTEPDGSERTASARVPGGTRDGDVVEVWFDSRGRSVAAPPDSFSIWQYTLTMGACATGGAVALILLGRAVVRHVATRRRLAEWEEDWARTEPEWSRRRWA